MHTFMYIRGCGIQSIDRATCDALLKSAHEHGWTNITYHIDQKFLPLFSKEGNCLLLEVMKRCQCTLLFVAGAEQLSINPRQLVRFSERLKQEGMRVFLQAEQEYLDQWIEGFCLLEG